MSKKLFSNKEIKILIKNPNVKAVSTKSITYSDEFKRTFVAENKNGKLPRKLFETDT